jgi:hypothetical protein
MSTQLRAGRVRSTYEFIKTNSPALGCRMKWSVLPCRLNVGFQLSTEEAEPAIEIEVGPRHTDGLELKRPHGRQDVGVSDGRPRAVAPECVADGEQERDHGRDAEQNGGGHDCVSNPAAYFSNGE